MSKITASTIVNKAVSQIGVKESPANSNRQKYGDAYGWNGVSWCVIFVWWVFYSCGASKLFANGKKYAGCSALIDAMKPQFTKGHKGIKKGDIVFFDFKKDPPDHVGICESVTATKVTTIDGNTSEKGSQSNGGMVCRRTRDINSVYGYIRPKYDAETPTKVKPVVAKPTIKQGSEGQEVRYLQQDLNYLGFKDDEGKSLALDGHAGKRTMQAFAKFQKKYGLKVDKIYGQISYAKMKKVL